VRNIIYANSCSKSLGVNGSIRRKIGPIESNAKGRHKKKLPVRDFAAGVYLREAPYPPRFLFGVVWQFFRF
jgi:hypothetical protein